MGTRWRFNEISTWCYSHRKTVHIHSYSNQLTAPILLLLCHNTRPSSSTPLVFVPLQFADLKFILLKRAHLTMQLINPSPWFLAFYHFCAIGKFYQQRFDTLPNNDEIPNRLSWKHCCGTARLCTTLSVYTVGLGANVT